MPRKVTPFDTTGRDLLNKEEVAQMFGVSVHAINRWVKRGLFIKPIYLTPNGRARWRLRDLEAFLAKKKVERHKPTVRGVALQSQENARA